jgi:hypothetical protein
MSPEITVMNPETKSNYVDIRKHRADSASDPDAGGNAWPVETGSDADCGDGMRENGWHTSLPLRVQEDNL